MGSRFKLLFVTVLAMASLATLAYVVLAFFPTVAQAAEAVGIDPSVARWGLVAAAITTGVSTLAAGFAVASVGAAGVGAMAEKPELFGRTLVLVGLAEGIAIYGLILSIMILDRVT